MKAMDGIYAYAMILREKFIKVAISGQYVHLNQGWNHLKMLEKIKNENMNDFFYEIFKRPWPVHFVGIINELLVASPSGGLLH